MKYIRIFGVSLLFFSQLSFAQGINNSSKYLTLNQENRNLTTDNTSILKNVTTSLPPKNVKAKGYGRHIEVLWDVNIDGTTNGYRVYKLINGIYTPVASLQTSDHIYLDYLDSTGVSANYKVSTVDANSNESVLSNEVSASTKEMSDDEYLTMLQEATFRYFWDNAHPVSGLARERTGSGNTVTIGGSGFGVMAILVGIERGFITRQQGADRMLRIVRFLETNAPRFHGIWPHWLNGASGEVIPFGQYDDGGDLVESSFMLQGLLAARQYFNEGNAYEVLIRMIIDRLWKEAEFDWYRKSPTSNFLYWHWSPNFGWQMNIQITGWSESMIVYILGIASPTHGVPASLYKNGWEGNSYYKNGKTFYGYKLDVGWDYGGPLFFAHYSFLGFDPRNKKDSFTNYFVNNKNHTLIHREYAKANPKGMLGYNQNTWGMTASDDPFGYSVHEVSRDNGTISPTAALSSMPYTPSESIAFLKNIYNLYGNKLWGIYGFKDAFNVKENWYASSYVAIDQGPIIGMVENYRSQLLWNNFMKNSEIDSALKKIGFVADLSDVEQTTEIPKEYALKQNFPNPFNPGTVIKYQLAVPSFAKLVVYDMLGRIIAVLVNDQQAAGDYSVSFDASKLASGVYIYQLNAVDANGQRIFQARTMLLTK